MSIITLIAAMDPNGAIGKAGRIPWKISEDMERFAKLTTGHPCIMGRVTWLSLPKKFRPLPNRPNIVVTTNAVVANGSAYTSLTLPSAIKLAKRLPDSKEIFLIGGRRIYEEGLALANRMEITEVEQIVTDADTFFPAWDKSAWKEVLRQPGRETGYQFVTYEKV